MVPDPAEMAAVLADPTRMILYEKLAASRPSGFTARELAKLCYLHPNVVRTHLRRLESVGLIEARTERTGRGGRPARRYVAADRATLTLQLPRRDWQGLAQLLLRTLANLGASAFQEAVGEAYREGARRGREAAESGRVFLPLSVSTGDGQAWASGTQAVAAALQETCGVELVDMGEDRGLRLRATSCLFRELAESQPESVCPLHGALVRGFLEAVLGPVRIEQLANMVRDGQGYCEYRVTPAAVSSV